ncbi:FAD-binding protein [Alteriqipengyuania flavescens]|uniref:FAD-binding protein n=1 Tax=Alteriqipengyuania flavescens TaxID=3053610 RepID=UPI0025B3128D|nr:FAD-binding protein [Alteriqipengyuania flavescens]WJY18100.1 FAD-binding protein [Alteriqipengyuania flavescens]WJY24041.1 FAD-binding protein [Alteriqipengyuania flavescens]
MALGAIREAIRRRKAAKKRGISGPRELWTHMRVFRCEVDACLAADEAELARLVRGGKYACVGKSHSYNAVQLCPGNSAVMMEESGLDTLKWRGNFDGGGIATVGASVTILELKQFLLTERQRLMNSGNYMGQTVIGALVTGTHGYGETPVMADALQSLTFLDDEGERVTLVRGSRDFNLAAVSFGTIAPIVEVEIRTVPLRSYLSTAHITRMSEKEGLKSGSVAASWAAMPYSDPEDPLIMLHTLHELGAKSQGSDHKPSWFSLAGFVNWALNHYWAIDRLYPVCRRWLHKFADGLDLRKKQTVTTRPDDLDYLYDPQPGAMSERGPEFLRGMFSTTNTAHNLAFFVPLERAEAVVKFIMLEAGKYSDLGFYLKSLIGVRELRGRSDLVFAATHDGPVAAIDLFSDPRDYAWLERIQREVMAYEPAARPHFGKSALGEHFRPALGEANLDDLFQLHRQHFPSRRLKFSEPVRRLLQVGRPTAGNSAADAMLALFGGKADRKRAA